MNNEYTQNLKTGADIYQNSMKSIESISRELNVKRHDLRKYMEENNIPRRKCGDYKYVTNESQNDEITKLYLSGYSLRGLAKQFNVDRDVILRVLRDKNVEIRKITSKIDPETAIELFKNGFSHQQIAEKFDVSPGRISLFFKSKNIGTSPDIAPKQHKNTQTIIEKYLNGESASKIRKDLKMCISAVIATLKQNNIEIKPRDMCRRKYSLDINYFEEIHTPNKYLMLGILYTDGYNSKIKCKLSLELQERDKETVEYVKNELKTDAPLRFSEQKKTYSISAFNEKITTDLANLGCSSPKSYNLKFPNWIRDDIFQNFLHGCLIGDGWISAFDDRNEKNIQFGIVGTEDMVKGLQEKVYKLYNVHGCVAAVNNVTWKFVTNKYSAVHLCNQMFRNAPFLMQRKYEIYKNFVLSKKHQINDLRYSEDREIMREALKIVNKIESQNKSSPLESPPPEESGGASAVTGTLT